MILNKSATEIDIANKKYNGKTVCDILRLWNFIVRYCDEYCYMDCINIPELYQTELSLKKNEMCFEEAKRIRDECVTKAKAMSDSIGYNSNNNFNTYNFLNDLIVQVMKQAWKQEEQCD